MALFCIIMILLIGVLFFRLIRNYTHKEITFNTAIARALLGMLVISFVSVIVLWIRYQDAVANSIGKPGLFPAIVYTVQMYSLDTNVEFFRTLSEAAGTAANILLGLLMVINPVLLLGTISRMILQEAIRFSTNIYLKSGDLFVFPFHDERAVMLAESILKEKRGKILFTSLSADDEESRKVMLDLESYNVPAAAFTEDTVVTVLNRLTSGSERHITVFFTVANFDIYEDVFRTLYAVPADLYIFTNELETKTVDSISRRIEKDMAKKGRTGKAGIQTYCIDPVKDSIWRHILKLSAGEDASKDPFRNMKEKEITVSVAGWTPYGEEILKTMMWLGNIYGHVPHIRMYDTRSEEALKDLFLYHFPAFSELHAQDMTYKYRCKGNTLVCENLFTVELHSVPSLKSDVMVRSLVNDGSLITAFTLRNDEDTVRLLQKYIQRCDLGRDQYLFVHCEDEDIAEYAASLAVKDTVHISMIGVPAEFYSYASVVNKDLEDLAAHTHLEERRIKALSDPSEKIPPREEIIREYRESDYNRRSSMASSLQKKLSVQSIPRDLKNGIAQSDRRPLIVVEHDRWSAYMITLGYIPADRNGEGTIKPALRHTDITPYEYLPEDVKAWDNVTYIMSGIDEASRSYLQNLEDTYKEEHA